MGLHSLSNWLMKNFSRRQHQMTPFVIGAKMDFKNNLIQDSGEGSKVSPPSYVIFSQFLA